MSDFNFFVPISKVEKQNDGSCIVSGYASSQTRDLDGEIVSLDAIKKAWPSYWEYRNVREMHQPRAVGVGKESHIDDFGPFLRAKIVDRDAVQKCIEEVYKGFSIGGRKLAKSGDTITELELIEVSLVDRPANPDCRINVAKRAKGAKEAYLLKALKAKRDPSSRALSKMAQAVELISKSGPPAARDGFSLPAKPNNSQPSPKDPETQNNKASGACEEHGVVGCKDCMDKREFSDKERQAAARSGAAEPSGSFPIKDKTDLDNARRAVGRSKNPATTRAHIRSRAQALGVKLPAKWKKKQALKLLKRSEKSITKSANLSLLSLSPPAQKSSFLVLPGAATRPENRKLGTPLVDPPAFTKLGSSVGPTLDLDEPGGSEVEAQSFASDPSDFIKTFLSNYEDEQMSGKAVSNGSENSGLDLDTAVMNILKRGMAPTRAKRMQMAQENLRKARKARKDAEEAIKECHASLSKRYLAKMQKAGKKPPDDDEDEMAETEKVLKGLQKAHSALTTIKTFVKAADSQIAKAAARSGQRGQEVNDGEDGVYTPPAGIKDLSPGALATAGGTSTPPLYPGDGSPYPGKLAKFADKNGMIPAHVAELVAQNSALEAQTAVLSRASSGPRPYAFDMAKVYAGDGGSPASRQKSDILMSGINVADLQSQDDNVRTKASATVVGNMLLSGPAFGKSIISPEFRGHAGTGKNSV